MLMMVGVVVILGQGVLPPPLGRAHTAAADGSAYKNAVLADSPYAYLPLDETAGTTASDISGNGNNGTYTGSMTLGGAGPFGSSSKAATFGGTGQYVALGSALVPAGGDWTVEAWVNGSGDGFGNGDPVWSQYFNSSSNRTIGYACSTGSPRCVGGQVGSAYAEASSALTDGTWCYVVWRQSGSTLSVWVNGIQVASLTNSTAADTYATWIGGLNHSGWATAYYDGKIAQFAVYHTALSNDRVRAHYNASGVVNPPASNTPAAYRNAVLSDGPYAYLPLDESSGNIAYDATGNLNNGEYRGGVVIGGGGPFGGTSTAAAFSGTGQYVYLGSALVPTTGDWTVEAWVNGSGDGFGNGDPIWSQYFNSSSNRTFGYACGTGSPRCMGGQVGSAYAEASSALTDGTWYYVAWRQSGSTLSVWVNGIQMASGTNSTAADTHATWIGGLSQPNWATAYYHGAIGQFAVYHAALSTNRIAAHFAASGRIAPPIGGPVTSGQAAGGGINNTGACSSAGLIHGNRTANPVDTESGNFWHTFTDISIAGRSCPLQVSRTYNSQSAAANSPFGYGWQFNYAMSLAVIGTSPNQVSTITQENGSQVAFNQPASGSTWPPSAPRYIATLVHNADGSWGFTRQNRYTYSFNSSGQFTSITDLNRYVTTLTYTSGNLTRVTDPAGRTLTLGWTGGHITSVTDGNVTPNRSVTYSYDGSGNLQDVTDVGGGDTHFTYDSSHRVLTMKDPKCQALGTSCPGIQNHYDASGRIDWQKDQLNRQTSFVYAGSAGDASGGTTTTTDPKSNVTVEGYEYGVRTFVTRGSGTAQAATTRYLYDPATLALTSIADPNGNASTQTVDSSGNVLTSTDSLGRTTTSTYNSFNQRLTTSDGNGITTTDTYDSHGNLTRSSRPVSGTACPCQVTTYNRTDSSHPGDVTSLVDPDSKTTTYGYDSYGNRNAVTDPLGDKTTEAFNADGWMVSSVSPKGNVSGCGCASTFTTTYAYNPFGETTSVTDPLGHTTTRHYDADGNSDTSTDGAGNVTTNVYDLANQQTQVKRADSPQTVLSTDYNPDGTVLDQKDGKNNAIQTLTYDAAGRVTTTTDALGNVTTYTYDAAGNRLTTQDPGGNCAATPKTGCTTSTYDADNELQTVTYSDGLTPNVTSITYDSDGQRTGMTDGTGTSAWVWDNLHRVTSYTNGNGAQVQWSYNLRNLAASITYPGNKVVTRGYDGAGRWTTVQDWLSPSNTTAFGYDANSNLSTETFPSGSGVVDAFSFDAADRLMGISDTKAPVTLFAATYTRDNANQLSSDTSAPAATGSYRYTALNQVCYAGSANSSACSAAPTGSQPFAYDAADNVVTLGTTTQQFNAADELCWTVTGSSSNGCSSAPSGTTAFTYDTRGNRTTVTPAVGNATTLAYDQANRLTSWTQGSATASYGYNGDGLRMSKTSAGATSQFVWDQSSGLPLLLRDGPSTNSTYYVYGPGGVPVEQVNGTTPRFYHHDQLGSTRLITDITGSSQAAYSYDAYGNLTASAGTVTNPLRLGGQYQDAESGFYYLRARYYDPGSAQFLSRDPAVATTRSAYAYVADNPLNASDPSGLCGLDIFQGCDPRCPDSVQPLGPWQCQAANAIVSGLSPRIPDWSVTQVSAAYGAAGATSLVVTRYGHVFVSVAAGGGVKGGSILGGGGWLGNPFSHDAPDSCSLDSFISGWTYEVDAQFFGGIGLIYNPSGRRFGVTIGAGYGAGAQGVGSYSWRVQ
jgi:RHS repeat-associated protein